MMVRYTKERQQIRRKQKFELGDEEEELDQQIGLTHGGMPIDQLDDFNEPVGNDTDEDPENPDDRLMDDEIVNKLHFGGAGLKDSDDEEQGDLFTVKKTREQVFAEIMLKSKYFKEKRIEEKEENEELIQQLD